MRARDVMTQPVLSVAPDAPISQAIRLMLQKKISGLPVVDGAGRLVGLVTEGDFLRRAEAGTERKRPRWIEFLMGPGKLAEQYTKSHGARVSEVMTADVRTATEDTPLEDIVGLMERHHIKRVPILRGDALVGIVTRANLLRALASVTHEVKPASAGDAEIRERIFAALKAEKWAPLTSIEAIVRDGVVTLSGFVLDDRQRGALKVLAENVAGVKEVRDHMVWIEPVSGAAIESEELRAGTVH